MDEQVASVYRHCVHWACNEWHTSEDGENHTYSVPLLGTAKADGRNNSFSSFVPPYYSDDTDLRHPVFTVLSDLTTPLRPYDPNLAYSDTGTLQAYSVFNMIGYFPVHSNKQSGDYQ